MDVRHEVTWTKDRRTDEWMFVGQRGLEAGAEVVAITRSGKRTPYRVGEQLRVCPWDNFKAFFQIGECLERRIQEPLPDVPAGHYAIPSMSGHQDFDFIRIDRPTEGKWAGRTFGKRVIGGRPGVRIGRDELRDVLEQIAVDPAAAGARYGQEIGRCCRCNRHLTDEESRRLGIGPDCRNKD